ncbi:uncharacterized protein [Pleurodeles waltl]|uniref:uncharacterized protein n=1 Tax=Pleurodeles waltl TaxID=8319 RepID=UPI003709BCE8
MRPWVGVPPGNGQPETSKGKKRGTTAALAGAGEAPTTSTDTDGSAHPTTSTSGAGSSSTAARADGAWRDAAAGMGDEEHGSPDDMPVPDFPDDMDDEPINIPQETIQMVLESLQTPPSVTRRSTEEAATTGEPPATPIVRPASSNTAEDSDDTGTSFERTVIGVQRELAKEVRVGMQTMAASLEGVRSCMMSSEDQAAAMQT